jgi:hypothetical protein
LRANSKHVLVLLISILLTILGLVFLIRSSTIGFNAAEQFLANRGGMDTSQFNIIIVNYIEAYRWIGAILLAIGASTSIYTVLKNDFLEKINSSNDKNKDSEIN